MKKVLPAMFLMCYSVLIYSQTNTHALFFSDCFVEIPHTEVLTPATAMTIEAWIKPNGWADNIWENYIVGKDDWSAGTAGYALRGGAGGSISFNLGDGSGWQEVISDPLIPSGIWTHVAGTFDGSDLRIYIDGFPVGIAEFSGEIFPSSYNLNIGNVPFLGQGNRLFNGGIDQVDLWNIALTESQINDFISCSPTGTETGLIGLWNFEEGSGNAAADLSPYHHNGTLVNEPDWSTDVPPSSCTTIGTEDIADVSLAVFPNPNNGTCTVSSSTGGTCRIMNQWGQQVRVLEYDSRDHYKVRIENLEPGVYFVNTNNTYCKFIVLK